MPWSRDYKNAGKDRIGNIEDGVDLAVNTLSSLSWFSVKDTTYGAKGDGVSDDTTQIQAALTAANAAGGGTVWVPRGTYIISASLVIYSNTKLWLDPTATIRLKAGSNCNMIHNAAWVAGSGRDIDINIVGGTWDRLNNAGSGQQLHSILLQRVDQLYVGFINTTSTGGKYEICVYACSSFVVEEIYANTTASDCVHLSGACTNGRVSGIYGTTGDDSVALTTVDYAAYNNGDLGDMSDITIERVYTTAANGTVGVKVLAGTNVATPTYCKKIVIRNVATSTTGPAVWIGGDTADANTQNGHYRDINVSNVSAPGTGHTVQVINGGTGTFQALEFSHIASGDTANKRAFVFDGGASNLNIGSVTIRDCYLNFTNPDTAIYINSAASVTTCVIAHMVIENCFFDLPANTYAIKFNGTGTTITTLKAHKCRLAVASAGAGLVTTTGSASQALNNFFVNDLTVDSCAHVLGDFGSGFVTNAYVNGLVVTGSITDLAFVRSGATLKLYGLKNYKGSNADTIGSTGTSNTAEDPIATPTYSASITPAAVKGRWQTITVTNATAFTVNAPTTPPDSVNTRELTIEVFNNSGGVMGVITWNAIFVFAGATWTNPASTKKRFARFEWNGSAWVCTGVAAADY